MKKSKKKKRSAIGIVFNSRQEVLLVKRRDVPIWTLPGGGIEEDESPEVATIREILEETGLKVRIERPVAFYTPINHLANDTYTFACSPLSGQLSTSDETREVGFFALDAFPSPFFFLHQEWLEDALKNAPTIIQRPLDRVTYWNLFKYFCRHPLQVSRFLLSLAGKPINTR